MVRHFAALPQDPLLVGIYSNYLDTLKTFDAITKERKAQLRRIGELRHSDVLVIAGAIGKNKSSIDQTDIIPIADQLDGLSGNVLDVILETPGGSGEITEEIVRLLRRKHKAVNFIVPGTAKSAGTIMVMAGDEILMGSLSALGPIDAQLLRGDKVFSAEAFLQGLEQIKKESDEKQGLNRAYIPILQGISPGEIEAAKNALKFGKSLAAKWLAAHKFQHWTQHSSSGKPVTAEERVMRADDIADELGSHTKWLSHGRSIKMDDLEQMGIKITDYEKTPDLNDAIRRYHTLLLMSFEINLAKIYETPTSQIYRFLNQVAPQPQPANADQVEINYQCPQCKQVTGLVAGLSRSVTPQLPKMAFPKNNKFTCPHCHAEADLTTLRMQIEAQLKKTLL